MQPGQDRCPLWRPDEPVPFDALLSSKNAQSIGYHYFLQCNIGWLAQVTVARNSNRAGGERMKKTAFARIVVLVVVAAVMVTVLAGCKAKTVTITAATTTRTTIRANAVFFILSPPARFEFLATVT